ncbi:MAG TPA: AMP-binding protein, partial [Deferrisomatales bacterium]|nr:AMP-binding protein [Deferrisomatales bacterium]
ADLGRSLTFRQWNERSNRLANGLLGLGLAKGERVACLAHNRVEWLEYYVAAAKAGLVCVPILFRLAPAECRHILEDSGAAACLVDASLVATSEALRGDLDQVRHWVHLGAAAAPEGYLAYEDLLAGASPEEPRVDVHHRDLWTLTYTSGTTGRPKGAMRSHESYAAFFLTNIVAMEFNRHDRGLLVMPFSHINSIFYSFSLTCCGATAIVYDRPSFDPEHLLQILEERRITFTSLVPTHYVMILALDEGVKGRHDVACVRKLLCSSAPARRETKRGILEFFSNSDLYEAYGSTEAGKVTLLTPDKQFEKLGSIGREIPGTGLIRLLDEERNEITAPGQVGELFSRTSACFDGYWKQPETTAAAFEGQWFSAGDLAYRDAEGYFYLVDRKKNMIISGGENVYPSEVEEVVAEHPAVSAVAVIGLPDEKWGELVAAVVVLAEGCEACDTLADEIAAATAGKIAGYKRPRRVIFVPADELPRTATGKVLHRQLRDRFGHWSGA